MRSEELRGASLVSAARRSSNALVSPAAPVSPTGLVSPIDRAWVEVDLDALAENTRNVCRFVGRSTQVLAVVKADGYGHGVESVARTVLKNGATMLGVATVAEGVYLRECGVRSPILVLGYVGAEDSLEVLVEQELTPTICSAEHGMEFARAIADRLEDGRLINARFPLGVHLKIDTGMARLGVPVEEVVACARTLYDMRNYLRVDGVYSHLACADHVDTADMEEQRRLFERTLRQLRREGHEPSIVHLANSAAMLSSKAFHYDMVRVGLALYGMCPAPHLEGRLECAPVLQVRARITQVRDLPAGRSASYGCAFVAERDLRIATVGIGYADGVPWRLSHRMQALVHGRRVRQVGRVTMDQLIIDVTDLPGVATGDVVTLLGRDGREEISAWDWAEQLETIPWEILCQFKSRLPRVASERQSSRRGGRAEPETVHRRVRVLERLGVVETGWAAVQKPHAGVARDLGDR